MGERTVAATIAAKGVPATMFVTVPEEYARRKRSKRGSGHRHSSSPATLMGVDRDTGIRPGSAGMEGATCVARSKRERETHRYVVHASFGCSTGGRLAGNPLLLVANSTAAISVLTAEKMPASFTSSGNTY